MFMKKPFSRPMDLRFPFDYSGRGFVATYRPNPYLQLALILRVYIHTACSVVHLGNSIYYIAIKYILYTG